MEWAAKLGECENRESGVGDSAEAAAVIVDGEDDWLGGQGAGV